MKHRLLCMLFGESKHLLLLTMPMAVQMPPVHKLRPTEQRLPLQLKNLKKHIQLHSMQTAEQ